MAQDGSWWGQMGWATGHWSDDLGPVDDLVLAEDGTLWAASRAGMAVASFATGGTFAAYQTRSALPHGALAFGGFELAVLDIDGAVRVATTAVTSFSSAKVPVYTPTSSGGLASWPSDWTLASLGSLPKTYTAVDPGAGDRLYVAGLGDAGVRHWTLEPSGLSGSGTPVAQAGGAVQAMTTAHVGTKDFLITLAAEDDTIRVHDIAPSGATTWKSTLGAHWGLGIDAPNGVEAVTIDGQTYLLVTSAGTSSLTALRLGADGGLTPTDHVLDTRDTRFEKATSLAVTQDGDRVFVAVGGADDGVSVFQLLPHGALVHIASAVDDGTVGLRNVAALEAGFQTGTLTLYAGSAVEDGLTTLTLDLGASGQVLRVQGTEDLDGTALADVLYAGGNGKDYLRGYGGDDVLVGAGDIDNLYGGTGRDIFVIVSDGEVDKIRDFEVGLDRIDLSAWDGLRSISQLQFIETGSGGRIRFGQELLYIYSSTGTTIDDDVLAAHVLDPMDVLPEDFTYTTPPVVTPPPEDPATEGADTITGTAGDDAIDGRGGSDRLEGVDGADHLAGGSGDDWVDGGAGADTLDGGYGNDQILGRWGDDHILGGAGDDNIAASDGNDVVDGGAGNDSLGGGTGTDHLMGGAGHDILGGGDGRDTLDGGGDNDNMSGGRDTDDVRGGTGNDTLAGSYGDDLVQGGVGDDSLGGGPGRDTLHGGDGNDAIGGGFGFDLITGGDGDDFLAASEGQDTLSGDAGNDTLNGGTGNDHLRGGQGADVFVFTAFSNTETDVILDFEDGIDLLRLKAVQGGFGNVTVADASQGGLTQTELTYAGHTILLQGVTSTDISGADFWFTL